MKRSIWLLGVLAGIGCGENIDAPTQLLVKVEADEYVQYRLRRLEVDIFKPGATDADKPFQSLQFGLTPGAAHDGLQQLPFSFGITQGTSDAIEIVARGYAGSTDRDKGETEIIERKVVTTFRTGTLAWAQLYMSEKCAYLPQACEGLDRTCSPPSSSDADARAGCGAVDEIDATRGEPKGPPANVAAADSGGCADAVLCTNTDYACVDSTTSGYECRGQFAEWPMPREASDTRWPPHYTPDADMQTVHDDVTGLVWQRSVPENYAGCTGTRGVSGNACRWQEAKQYCEDLELGGESDWRLPSKIELESIISETRHDPALDPLFPIAITTLTVMPDFWTASQTVKDSFPDRAWHVSFSRGLSDFETKESHKLVRCVRSVTTRPGTPSDRYVIDTDADTIVDQRTLLVWQRSVGPHLDTEVEAEAYCKDRGQRLPGKRELLSLIDPSRPSPPVDPSFPMVPRGCFWTSTRDTIFPQEDTWFVICWSGHSSDSKVIKDQNAELSPDQPELAFMYARCVSDAE